MAGTPMRLKPRTSAVAYVLGTVACLFNLPSSPAADFHLTLVGNSMINMGVDLGAFASSVNHEVEVKIGSGAFSLWKFCTLWYACRAPDRPKYALVEFRSTELTDPMNRNTYGRDAIGTDAELWAIIAKVETDPPPLVSGNHDFPAALERCYLPYMVQVARSNGVDLIIARHKAQSYQIDENSPQDERWNTVMRYRQELSDYCQANGVFLLDYQFAPEIKFGTHYIAEGNDHLNYAGKTIWTGLLAADVSAILNGRRGTYELTSFLRMPGDWEWQHGLSARDGPHETRDTDGDGMSNYAEYLADTHPIDAASVLRFAAVAREGGGLRLTWQGGTAAVVHLEARTLSDLTPEAWRSVQVFSPPTPATNSFLETGGQASHQIYRLRAERGSL